MVLFYTRINWEDFPSVNTAINALRLNAMDYAIKTFDERTVALDTAKAEKSVVLNTIQDWSLDEETGIITITKVNGDVVKFDLNIEKIPVSFSLSEDGILTMTTDDGSKFTANIGAMIPVIAFENSDTISFTSEKRMELAKDFSTFTHEFDEPYTGNVYINTGNDEIGGTVTMDYCTVTFTYSDGIEMTFTCESGMITKTARNITKIEVTSRYILKSLEIDDANGKKAIYKASVKDGSIKDKHLESNYLANIKTQAENAELSATASAESAKEAKGYAEQAKESAESVLGAVGDISLNRQTLGYVKKNLLKNKGATTTKNGVTFTVNDDGSVTANGTATADIYEYIGSFIPKEGHEYIFTTGHAYSSVSPVCYIYNIDGSGSWKNNIATFTPTTNTEVKCSIYAIKGTVINNITFYPMIRSADITDDTYEPYVDDVDTRLKAMTPVANLLTTEAGKPLDATMGKELGDRVTTLENRIEIKQLSVTVNSGGYTNTIPINPDEYILLEVVQAEYIEPRSVFRLYPRYDRKDYSAYVTDVIGTTKASEGKYNILCVCIKR